MALAPISDRLSSPEVFNTGLQSVTDGILQSDPAIAGDTLEKFQGADFAGGEVANTASFPDPASAISRQRTFDPSLATLQTAVTDPNLNVSRELGGISPLLSSFSTFLPTAVEGVAANAGKSGEEQLGDAILDTQSSLDDLMQEASTLDPSTKEGQQRLAEIQLEFQQKSRQLQIMSQILADFQQLMKQIIQNL
jgi:hypothetical protein